jgi:cytochrome c oxidase assembly factor CtaG
MTGWEPIAHMAEMGLITSAVAPGILLLARRGWGWRWAGLRLLPLPAPVLLAGFVVLHAAITLAMDGSEPSPPVHLVLHAVLLFGALAFWLPVLGPDPLTPAGRMVYLFVGAPALDLAAVVVVARGDSAGGLAMIVAMLPIGLAALGSTWHWLVEEERAVRLREQAGTMIDWLPER